MLGQGRTPRPPRWSWEGHCHRPGDNEGVVPLRTGSVTQRCLCHLLAPIKYLWGFRVSAEVSAGSSPSGDIRAVTVLLSTAREG